MKRIIKIISMLLICFTVVGLTSCKKNSEYKTITRYTRDTESGTREGFFEKIGFKEAQKNNIVIPDAVEVSSNGVMLESVKNDEYGIGYVSLATAKNDVKALCFEGVEPTEENVLNGTYTLIRNFNYIVRTNEDMSLKEQALVKGFVLYMKSREGLAIIKSRYGIISNEEIANADLWNTIINKEENADVKAVCEDREKITISFGGSTSVEKMANALTLSFANVCKSFEAAHNHTGSGDAYKRTQGSEKDAQTKLHVGFLSRDLKAEEQAKENTSGLVCIDGISVIVNNNNSISNLTAEDLKLIYSGNKAWKDFE